MRARPAVNHFVTRNKDVVVVVVGILLITVILLFFSSSDESIAKEQLVAKYLTQIYFK